ncbi:hypothetical protein G6689_01700 [Polynucleobacter paneuropaeus]|nr:hypothetical protein G6716_01690 [Polynucleobacter paneuropaeus]QWD20107.1 hypothetical protein G6689_01700 [Polynucleobacter paneuropaeus]
MKLIFLKARSFIFLNLQSLFEIFNLQLLTIKKYESILSQRSNALYELIEKEKENLKPGISGVIFSRNRAFQLDALLTSYFEKVRSPAPLAVIYKATNLEHEQAYEEVISRFRCANPRVDFISQTNFQDSLLEVLNGINVQSIFFLVDDIIFIDELDLEIAERIDSSLGILSLRLSPRLTRSYTSNRNQLPPKFLPSEIQSDLLKFKWFDKGCEWSDPWSVDGNIYSTAEIKVLTRISRFSAPNSYEDCLKLFADLAKNRIGYCFKNGKILNLAINRVQNERVNASGDITADYLLEKWNDGFQMDRTRFESYQPNSPHEEHSIEFRRRC